MTMIWAGPERVFLGVGPPAVPSRISREVSRGDMAELAWVSATKAADRDRKSRRVTPDIVLARQRSFFRGVGLPLPVLRPVPLRSAAAGGGCSTVGGHDCRCKNAREGCGLGGDT